MIGNDIVDLKQAAKDSNWKRPRFLDKVFTVEEQQLIADAKNQHQMVWLLWSMKEAAYKVNVQQFGKRFFNPKRLECEFVSLEKGQVVIDFETYFTSSEISKDYVYTVAVLNPKQSYKSEWFRDKKLEISKQSDHLQNRFLKALNLDLTTIIKNNVGVPKLYCNTKVLNTSFSLTHHGAFSGYTML
ncbi:4'-phosphopantetheinyl transferase superfamily protein [Lacinutrix sp.]|uniref:4'-phosphopantetheinyl transferase family protein n=1 Tax=Lacinutrix sp. TaxID=1937692 RepID=UPI0025BA5133|nr:4'-phosphopantetheinyl transferase superfamily protein [Lacinutrix sp.]